MKKRILLVRHGQSIHNLLGIIQGNEINSALTLLGTRQVLCAVERIKNFKSDILYSSPLKRAAETASVIGDDSGLTPVMIDSLHEINAGIFTGKRLDECASEWRKYFNIWNEGQTWKKIPGGESFDDVAKRMADNLKYIVGNAGERIVVVSHNAAIGIFIKSIAGDTGSKDCIPKGGTRNGGAAISEVEFDDESGRFLARYAMDSSHAVDAEYSIYLENPRQSIDDLIEQAAENGFGKVSFSHEQVAELTWNFEEHQQINKLLKKNSVSADSLFFDLKLKKESVDQCVKAIEVANSLSIRTLILSLEFPIAATVESTREFFYMLAKAGAENGVRLAFRNSIKKEANCFLIEMLENISHSVIGFCYDTAAANSEHVELPWNRVFAVLLDAKKPISRTHLDKLPFHASMIVKSYDVTNLELRFCRGYLPENELESFQN
jgi:broad specificity phosphatase PhoE